MSIFTKKQDSQSPDSVEVPVSQVSKKGKKETMSSVLRESVLERSLDELQENQQFITSRDGETLYTCICLKAADIGGISKKANKDEAKGAIVESINNGRIKAIITPELMDAEEMVIIPDALTCDAMDEFSILVEAPYTIAFVHQDGSIEKTNNSVSFDDVKSFVENDGNIADFLVDHNVDFAKFYLIEDEAKSDVNEYWDDIPNHSDMPFEQDDEPEPDNVYDEIPAEDVEDVEYDTYEDEDQGPDFDEYEDYETAYDESPDIADVDEIDNVDEGIEEDVEEDISQDILEDAIVRRFYSDDLGLEVSTEPFDVQFMHANTYVPFDENRGEGWLNQYLNELSKSANIEMQRMHQANLIKMRGYYCKFIAMHCEQIQKDLDIDDVNTPYGKTIIKLNENKADAQKTIDVEISQKRQELEHEWSEKLGQVERDAAVEARQQYILRFGRQHDADLAKIDSVIQNRLEDDYQDSLRQINERRRSEAAKRLDYGVTEVLAEISKMYADCIDEEQAYYRSLSNNISEFLENNRREDIVHTELLNKQLEESKTAEKLMDEFKTKADAMTSEFEAKSAALNADIEKMRRDTEVLLANKEAECKSRVEKAQADVQNKQKEIDALVDKCATMDERKNKEFESRINELRNQCSAWEDKCDHIEATHKRNNTITVSLIVVAVIAALAIGTLIGLFVNVQTKQDTAPQQVYEYVENTNGQHRQEPTTTYDVPTTQSPQITQNDEQTVENSTQSSQTTQDGVQDVESNTQATQNGN